MKSIKQNNERVKYIDIMRGYAIFLIVFYHMIGESVHLEELAKYLISYHIALFFIISGFVYKIKENTKFIEYVKKISVRILFPYLFFMTISIIPYLIYGKIFSEETESIKHLLIGIPYATATDGFLEQDRPLWFLPCLFTVQLIAYFMFKLKPKMKNKFYLLIPLFMIIGYLDYKFDTVELPFGINAALNMISFFLIGYFLKEKKIIEKIKTNHKIVIGILLLIIGSVTQIFNTQVSYMLNDYGTYYIFLISSISSSIGVFILFSTIKKEYKYLELVGASTLGILIFHKLFVVPFQELKIVTDSTLMKELISSLILSVFTVVICTYITKAITKYQPALVGKNNTKKISNYNKKNT